MLNHAPQISGVRCQPTLIEYHGLRFLLSDMPNKCYMRSYIQELLQYNTRKLVRVCEEADYDKTAFELVGIAVEVLVFEDGGFPPQNVIQRWLEIIQHHYLEVRDDVIAVHCRSGLGRSAVLVAIALIERGMKPHEATTFIRLKRRGAFNMYQIEQIHKYHSRNVLHRMTETL